MKPLIISIIALALLSTTAASIAASQNAQDKIATVQEVSILTTLKNAFRFGFQSGWLKDGE